MPLFSRGSIIILPTDTDNNIIRKLLAPCVLTFIIRSYEAQNVFMAKHDGLVNFRFTEPRSFLSRRKYFYSNVLPSPSSSINFTIPAFPYLFY